MNSLSIKPFNNNFSFFLSFLITMLFAVALSGCDAPSDGLEEEQERSAKTATENVVTAESMNYDVKVTDLGLVEANSINDSGQIVGTKEIENDIFRAFLWENGEETILEPLPADRSSQAVAINNNGKIIGDSDGAPLSWRNGKICRLCILGPEYSVYDINNNGRILGRNNKRGSEYQLTYFTLKNGKFTNFEIVEPYSDYAIDDYYAINDQGFVASTQEIETFTGPPGYADRTFLWNKSKVRKLGTLSQQPGNQDRYVLSDSYAIDINNDGQIAALAVREVEMTKPGRA